MANKIADHMKTFHTKFIRNSTPTKLEKADPNGQITVTWANNDGTESSDCFDTVLFAIGRYALTEGINM